MADIARLLVRKHREEEEFRAEKVNHNVVNANLKALKSNEKKEIKPTDFLPSYVIVH